jgi:glycosyltransferase involved in cell wall biosynthesis
LRETAGDAALFFDPKDGDAITAAIERVLTDQSLRAHLRAAGLLRSAEFSWQAAAQKTLAVSTKVMTR